MNVFIHGLSTCVPPHALPQDEVRDRAHEILGPRFKGFDRLAPVFDTAGVRTRYSVAPFDWFEGAGGWTDRNGRYMDGATDLYVDAATQALDAAGWAAGEVDILVTVSSTGIATPTLEAQAKGRMGFRDDCLRVPLFGLGCAGGVSGLNVARELAAAKPDAKVLLVVVETCTLSFRKARPKKADIIATILFGDGAAAVALNGRDSGIRVERGASKTWDDTLPIMGWEVDEDGLAVVFDRSIPDFVAEEMRGAADAACAAMGITRETLGRLVSHPGGAKVVDALETSLELGQGTLDVERDVLRDYGNMSAPTVLFVLDRVLARGDAAGTGDPLLACALGPGFSAAFAPIYVD
ncbi:MAG: type III polyketide synthase [Pseudomonadota bacterium]